MKRITLLLASIILLFIFSCQDKDFNNSLITDNNIITQFKLDVNAINGTLHFNNSEEFYQSIELISDSEGKYISDEVLNQWEDEIGFKSMRSKYIEMENEFSFVENNTDLNDFISIHGNEIFDQDGSIKTPLGNENLASIVDIDGKVFIGNDLHCFLDNKQIIIIGGDLEKLNRALTTLKSSEENGIFVFDTNEENESAGSRYCGQQLITDTKYGYDKKLSAKWQIKITYSLSDGSSSPFINLPIWTTKKLVYSEMKSEKKANGLFGNYWKKHKDKLEFDYVYILKETQSSALAFSTGHLISCPKCDKLSETDVISTSSVNSFDKPVVPELPFFIQLDGFFKNTRLNLVGHKVCNGVTCEDVFCTYGNHCENGICVPDEYPIPQCNNDGDCLPGEMCVNGECLPF